MNDPVEGVQLSRTEPEHAEEPRPERVIVTPAPDSRLEALHAQYRSVKKAAEEAGARFSDLKAAIVAELEALHPGSTRPLHAYVLPASLYGPELAVYYKSQEYLPASSIRENLPDVYQAFKRVKEFSEVRESQAGRGRRK